MTPLIRAETTAGFTCAPSGPQYPWALHSRRLHTPFSTATPFLHDFEVHKVAWTPFSQMSPSNDPEKGGLAWREPSSRFTAAEIEPKKGDWPAAAQKIQAGALRCPDSEESLPGAGARVRDAPPP